MTLRLSARWLTGTAELDSRLLPLLRSVEKKGSLNQAVSALGLSYRHAWGLLGDAERRLGQPLVLLERGRGARLSLLGEQLLAADDAAMDLLKREMEPALRALNQEAARPARAPQKSLVIHASHDLALAALRDGLSRPGGVPLDLHFMGSIACLAGLAHGHCDIAGFHVPEAANDAAAYAPFRHWLRTRALRLVRFVRRRQGLIVPPGNPKRLQTLADLADKGARFVNRQPDSGTRLCFDRLLTAAHIRPSRINGYQTEEFTHAAVAATVASGMADAGFGIEAAARQQGLDFVPLATERYYLAALDRTLERPAARQLLEAMASPAFRRQIEALAGYDGTGIGERLSVKEALGRR